MKHSLILLSVLLWLSSCHSGPAGTTTGDPAQAGPADSRQVDVAAAQERTSMHMSVENFTLLNKKKYENLGAYQQFGDILQMHVDRMTGICDADQELKSKLTGALDRIRAEITILHGADMAQSKAAVHEVNLQMAQIDSTFDHLK